MKVAYISDLHLDSWIKCRENQEDFEEQLENQMFSYLEFIMGSENIQNFKETVLVIAGDLSHFNYFIQKFLEMMKSIFKEILLVPGNHDYYLITTPIQKEFQKNSYNRISDLKRICKDLGVHFLDGQIVEIDGKKFGGTMMSWDRSFYERYFKRPVRDSEIKNYYTNCMADARFMMNGRTPELKQNVYEEGNRRLIGAFDQFELLEKEKSKMNNYNDFDDIDVIVTHYAPHVASNLPEHFNNESTTFFTYDGRKDLERISPKYWVFGHQHFVVDDLVNETRLVCNPLGYKNEIWYPPMYCKFKFFEI